MPKKHESPSAALVRAIEQLHAHGHRLTAPRRAMLAILTSQHGPFSAEELHRGMGRKGCDVVTVYRSLQAMEEIGLLRRCDFGDGTYRYEFNVGEHHHHHIICRICRGVEMLQLCVAGSLEQLALRKGYRNVTHTLEVFGVCPQCVEK